MSGIRQYWIKRWPMPFDMEKKAPHPVFVECYSLNEAMEKAAGGDTVLVTWVEQEYKVKIKTTKELEQVR